MSCHACKPVSRPSDARRRGGRGSVGGDLVGQSPPFAAAALVPVERDAIDDVATVITLALRLMELAARVHPRIGRVGKIDLVSQHFLVQVERRLESHRWMARAEPEP
jgi:hypothetical protein